MLVAAELRYAVSDYCLSDSVGSDAASVEDEACESV